MFSLFKRNGQSFQTCVRNIYTNKKNVVAQFLSLNRHQLVDNLRLFEK